MVEMPARLEIQPEVKTSAASLPCRSASSRSEHDDRMMGAGNVAGAAGAGAVGARRLDARLDDVGVDAHAEIVVRAPDGDLTRRVLFARRAPQGEREAGGVALEVGEDAIALFALQAFDRFHKTTLIIHRPSIPRRVRRVGRRRSPRHLP